MTAVGACTLWWKLATTFAANPNDLSRLGAPGGNDADEFLTCVLLVCLLEETFVAPVLPLPELLLLEPLLLMELLSVELLLLAGLATSCDELGTTFVAADFFCSLFLAWNSLTTDSGARLCTDTISSGFTPTPGLAWLPFVCACACASCALFSFDLANFFGFESIDFFVDDGGGDT